MIPESRTFTAAVLDALAANIAVLDGAGVIVWANQRWKQFARDNGGAATDSYVGANYLATCEAAACDGGDAVASAMLDGLRSVAGGERSEFVLEYPCHSPQVQRWFLARATRCEGPGGTCIVIAHENITARKLAEAALTQTERALRLTLEALPVGVWVMDAAGRIVHGNAAGQRIWAGARYVGPEHFGEYKGWWLATGKPIEADEWAAARAIGKGETSIDEEIRIQCFDGSSKVILNSAIPLRDEQGAISGAIIVNQDISARVRADEELRLAKGAVDAANKELRAALEREQRAARTDELTGAHNRRHFFDVAGQLFDVARRYGQPLSLILLDIDHFKEINDRHGHQAGDRMLQQVVVATWQHLRAADVFARYGGEEFIVLLPDSTAQQAAFVAERMREGVRSRDFDVGTGTLRITISAGVATLRPGDDSLEALVRRADRALYLAKERGRDRVVASDDDADTGRPSAA